MVAGEVRALFYLAAAVAVFWGMSSSDQTFAVSASPDTLLVTAMIAGSLWLLATLALGSVATVVWLMGVVRTFCMDAALFALVSAVAIVLYTGANPAEVLRAVTEHVSRVVDAIVWMRDIFVAVAGRTQ